MKTHEADRSLVFNELQRRRSRRLPGGPIPWWPAADIADRVGRWAGRSRETQRRRVRELIDDLRTDHPAIIASGQGYALAIDIQELAEYQDRRRRQGLTDLAAAGQVKGSVPFADATGQGALFTG